jgi:hypothetical protein
MMAAVVEQAATRPVRRTDGRSWLRWGLGVFAGVETVHLTGGTLGNDWEGWNVFLGTLVFVVVTGVVIVGLTYGMLVRWGLKASPRGRNRPAVAAFAAGTLSLAAYPAFFMWAPVLIAPAALLLGRVGLGRARDGQGGRAYAVGGTLLGVASLAIFLAIGTYAVLNHGNYPWVFGG